MEDLVNIEISCGTKPQSRTMRILVLSADAGLSIVWCLY